MEQENGFNKDKVSCYNEKSSFQLNFIADIIRKKKEEIDIRKTQEINTVKNLRDYEYYDIIVRDIIS